MYVEFVKFLTSSLLVFSLVEFSLGCGNHTRQKRQDGLDLAGTLAAGAAMAVDMAVDILQQGGGYRNNFKIKIGNEN